MEKTEVKVELVEFKEFVARVQADYPELRLREGRKFMFRPRRTVVYPKDACGGEEPGEMKLRLLHEMGHALAGHFGFRTDVERLKMEREAWEKARELSERYGVRYDEELVEADLDTYRDWLHRRSQCRKCGLTRYQTERGEYLCPWCDQG